MNKVNDETMQEVDNLVCLVIDRVMENEDLADIDCSLERADLYRLVGNELLDMAHRMEGEVEYERRFGNGT